MIGPDPDLAGRPSARSEIPYVDRRGAVRRLPCDVRGTILWRGEGGEVAREVALLNLSGGGAAVVADEAPPAGQVVRFRLERESTGIEVLEATVIAIAPGADGRRALRLRFEGRIRRHPRPASGRDRRLWTCYPVREAPASLSWIDGEARRTIHGALLNLSGGGAAFASDAPAPPGVPIWLRLESGDGPEPVESRLVGLSQDPSGLWVAHLRFLGPCPLDLFALAVP